MGLEDRSEAPSAPSLGGQPSGLVDRLDDLLLTLDRWRDRPLVVAAGLLVVLAAGSAYWWLVRSSEPEPVDELIPWATTSTALDRPVSTTAPVAPVVVHVVGEVVHPGLVTMPAGGRVSEAVELAGGPTPEADVHLLNLAAPVADGMQIRVPTRGEEPAGPLVRGAVGGGDGAGPQLIDVNRATAVQLEALPGVGPAIAAAIVAHRDDRGPFGTVDELLAVPGIGPAKLEAIRDLVTV